MDEDVKHTDDSFVGIIFHHSAFSIAQISSYLRQNIHDEYIIVKNDDWNIFF